MNADKRDQNGPAAIAPWFNTGALTLQALAEMEKDENRRMEKEGETSLPECREESEFGNWDLNKTREAAARLGAACLENANTVLSERTEEAILDEMKNMDREAIRKLPPEEREGLAALMRARWDE